MVGISSWGYDNCASYQYYGVYARVDAASEWIYSVVPYPPKLLVSPSVTGTFEVGQAVTCNTGTWDGSALNYSYKFEASSGVTLQEGGSPELALIRSHVNKRIRCHVTANGTGGSLEAISEYVGPVKAGADPTPAPEQDKNAPIIKKIRRSCRGTSCTVVVTGADSGKNQSGLQSIKAKGSWFGSSCSAGPDVICTPAKKRKLKITTGQRNATQFTVSFKAPGRGSYSMQIRIFDAAGNASPRKLYQWQRPS